MKLIVIFVLTLLAVASSICASLIKLEGILRSKRNDTRQILVNGKSVGFATSQFRVFLPSNVEQTATITFASKFEVFPELRVFVQNGKLASVSQVVYGIEYDTPPANTLQTAGGLILLDALPVPVDYFTPRENFSLFGMLANPMVLMMVLPIGLMFVLPKLTASLQESQDEAKK